MIYIYALSDPTTSEVRYVGKTINLRKRYLKHLNPSSKCKHCSAWIQGLLKEGLEPNQQVLETLSPDACWEPVEQKWIAYYKAAGCDLTNITAGGEGGATYGRLGKKNTPEHIKKSSRLGVSVKHTPESNKKRVEGIRRYYELNKRKVYQYGLDGLFLQEWESAVDAANALSIAHSGITKVCRTQKGRVTKWQWRYEKSEVITAYEKQIAWNKDTPLPEESKNKMSESKKGKPWTEARRAAQKTT